MDLLLTLIFWCFIIAVAWFILMRIPIPPPFRWIAEVLFALIVLVILIENFGGHMGFHALH